VGVSLEQFVSVDAIVVRISPAGFHVLIASEWLDLTQAYSEVSAG